MSKLRRGYSPPPLQTPPNSNSEIVCSVPFQETLATRRWLAREWCWALIGGDVMTSLIVILHVSDATCRWSAETVRNELSTFGRGQLLLSVSPRNDRTANRTNQLHKNMGDQKDITLVTAPKMRST